MLTKTLGQITTLRLRGLEEETLILFVRQCDGSVLPSKWSAIEVRRTLKVGSEILLGHVEEAERIRSRPQGKDGG